MMGINKLPEKYTEEGFERKLEGFGTLTFVYKTKKEKSASETYQVYKQRNRIECAFNAYKNVIHADVMYMQNRYVTEGWLLANFIAMLAYHKLFFRLKEVDGLEKFSPKDIIKQSKHIYKLKMNDSWHTAKISKKQFALFKSLKIDYLN